jgi:PRTRC genetic system protein E
MKTNFFTELEKFNINQYSLGIIFKDGVTTITLLPKANLNDKATKLKPLSLSAFTTEIDEHFFETLSENLNDTSTFFSNVEKYERKLEIQKNETQEIKEKKEKIKNLEEKIDKIFTAENFEPKKEENKIVKLCKEIITLDEKNKKAIEYQQKINNLTNKLF